MDAFPARPTRLWRLPYPAATPHDGAAAATAYLAVVDDDEFVHAGLGPPHLAGPAEQLAHIGR